MDAALREAMAASFTNYIGSGSDKKNRIYLEEALPNIIKQYKIRSVNDAGCGEQWVGQVVDVKYSPFDILPREGAEILDITSEVMPKADLIICRDVLFHLTDKMVLSALDNFRKSHSKYLLATSCYDCSHKRPSKFGNKAINSRLDLVPILGEPLEKVEEPFDKRFMGLWKL